jgi:hypothetical protein
MKRPGRPYKQHPLIIPPRADKIVVNITFLLTKVASWLHTLCVPDRYEIGERMRQRLLHECKSIAASRERIKSDIEAYHRVVDELEQVAKREKRINRIVGVFGEKECERLEEENKELRSAIFDATAIHPSRLRDSISLWEAMNEYLQYVPEARIGDMEEFFQAVEMENANRQAMESALKRHPETFKIRKDKREKYISLKAGAKEGV